ncbi:MAG: 50S ribosomal protein L5 [Candidatus Beckwithbacteria bacterium GW2011_GWA2_43_10]|uniref:Large ribosomal subunit protein uL5 n=1 Tax=Candidatus Beckwithbacteria bacterium GW2011_GWA2_43_10 TaxID=1618369 RepID=A0A0G1F1C1_9BACT|nr:MAG: 50S ribosomal protein L5 [Candidatus Beckwithbacteria bacterium GW2011_GWA2_43_10]
MNRLQEKYFKTIVPALKKEFKLTHDLAVPRLKKIVINLGIKDGAGDKGVAKKVSDYISLIAGQKAIITKARKAEAAFKIRQGDHIGVMATLRGERMYAFLDKLVSIVLPQVRDFKGISRTSFDGRGNYSLGFQEQVIFPEVSYDTIDQTRGFQVTLVTSATDNQTAIKLLELLGLPFTKYGQS